MRRSAAAHVLRIFFAIILIIISIELLTFLLRALRRSAAAHVLRIFCAIILIIISIELLTFLLRALRLHNYRSPH